MSSANSVQRTQTDFATTAATTSLPSLNPSNESPHSPSLLRSGLVDKQVTLELISQAIQLINDEPASLSTGDVGLLTIAKTAFEFYSSEVSRILANPQAEASDDPPQKPAPSTRRRQKAQPEKRAK